MLGNLRALKPHGFAEEQTYQDLAEGNPLLFVPHHAQQYQRPGEYGLINKKYLKYLQRKYTVTADMKRLRKAMAGDPEFQTNAIQNYCGKDKDDPPDESPIIDTTMSLHWALFRARNLQSKYPSAKISISIIDGRKLSKYATIPSHRLSRGSKQFYYCNAAQRVAVFVFIPPECVIATRAWSDIKAGNIIPPWIWDPGEENLHQPQAGNTFKAHNKEFALKFKNSGMARSEKIRWSLKFARSLLNRPKYKDENLAHLAWHIFSTAQHDRWNTELTLSMHKDFLRELFQLIWEEGEMKDVLYVYVSSSIDLRERLWHQSRTGETLSQKPDNNEIQHLRLYHVMEKAVSNAAKPSELTANITAIHATVHELGEENENVAEATESRLPSEATLDESEEENENFSRTPTRKRVAGTEIPTNSKRRRYSAGQLEQGLQLVSQSVEKMAETFGHACNSITITPVVSVQNALDSSSHHWRDDLTAAVQRAQSLETEWLTAGQFQHLLDLFQNNSKARVIYLALHPGPDRANERKGWIRRKLSMTSFI